MEVLSGPCSCLPRDLERSIRFYEETLGLAVYREWGQGRERGVVFFLGGGLLEIPRARRPSPRRGRSASSSRCATCAPRASASLAPGVPIEQEPAVRPWGLFEMVVRDPNGLALVFVEVPPTHPLRESRLTCWAGGMLAVLGRGAAGPRHGRVPRSGLAGAGLERGRRQRHLGPAQLPLGQQSLAGGSWEQALERRERLAGPLALLRRQRSVPAFRPRPVGQGGRGLGGPSRWLLTQGYPPPAPPRAAWEPVVVHGQRPKIRS